MTLYIDIENKRLVQSPTSDRAIPAPLFMQGDNEPLEIHLLEKGSDELFVEKPLTVGTDFLRVAIARFKGYPKLLTYAGGYSLNDGNFAEVVLPLNTTAIEQAVQDNEYVSAYLEVEYSNTDGKIVTVLQTSCRIANDLIDNAPAVEIQEQFYDKSYIDSVLNRIEHSAVPALKIKIGGTEEYGYIVLNRDENGNLYSSILTKEEYENE